MSEAAVRTAFETQSEACLTLGSPFTARLCALCAERLTSDLGRAAERVLSWSGDPSPRGQAVPLRLMGAFHALVLSGRSPALVDVYPPREVSDDDSVWQALAGALAQYDDWIYTWLDSPPQTNEVQRANGLFAGLSHLAERYDLPFVLSEVGSSAGLNLNAALYGYDFDGHQVGRRDSALQLVPEWRGSAPPNGRVEVSARQGCDLNPLDPCDPQHRLRLSSFVWPDQPDRLARLQAAFDIAAGDKPKVLKADAVDWISSRLAQTWSGHCHVVFHSIVLQYFPEPARVAFSERMMKALDQATPEAPLAWLRMESDGRTPGAALTVTTGRNPSDRLLGRIDFHGRWVEWHG